MIRIDALHKEFEARTGGGLFKRGGKKVVTAVEHLDLQAPNGRITGLLGPNGAGKTTSLRMLAGLFLPDRGTIQVDEIDVLQAPRAALARMGVLGDAHGLYPRLSARENIVYYARLQGMPMDQAQARAEALAELLDMRSILERRADGFSQGERMKTSLARALVHDPANIVLDEPTNGLDVLATRALREVLRHLRSPEGGNKCIVFSSHIMQEVEQLCDQVVVMSHGRSVATGSVEDLMAQTGSDRFEDAFVALAFPEATTAASGAAATDRQEQPA
ncbi:ABC transporter ATP-binding protein [Roseateles amylovorans]|jgi:sodium transport system ATP-binding protein|uniref:ATP-binding cassette domain-containing protein n=1 Tax=Roseateles amylovorans TaxID=2978473 RepID=A0ABY6B093_9BURK|nr:ATP-binding cassette domain-containing protein [Roseateles amylovorans]UXH78475.1 ATP-binding cassette domain-containing protein [Roseateles amylovorans]